MAGTFTIRQIGQGQLGNTTATLYTVPAATNTIIKNISVVNTGTSDRTINLYISTGTRRRIIPNNLTLDLGGGQMVYPDAITLEAGHLIEGDASVASVCDYVINGIEET